MFCMYLLNGIKASVYPIVIFFCIKKILNQYEPYSRSILYISYIFSAIFLVVAIKYSFINMANCLIFPEFTLTLLFLIYIFLYLSDSKSICIKIFMYLIFLCSLFFKETAFIIYFLLSLGQLIKKQSDKEYLYHISIVFMSFLYVLLYYIFVYTQVIMPRIRIDWQ
jgi:hypothetical protein